MDREQNQFKHVDPESVEILPDFPPGPLDSYRKQASFSWKKLRLFIEDEDLLKFKVNLLNIQIFYLKKCIIYRWPSGKPWRRILCSTNKITH
jgi:hypothetical protein